MGETQELPEPPVPAEINLRGLHGFRLDVQRLLNSEFWAISTGEEFKAAMALWCRAWQQVPAGSLPDDDRILSGFAGISPRKWSRMRAAALHGFVKCRDGRLYHPVLCEDALRAWEARQAFEIKREGSKHRMQKSRERRRVPAAVARNSGEDVARNVATSLRARQDIDKTLPPLPPKPEENGAPKVDGGQVEQAVFEIMRLAGKARVCTDLTGTRWVLEQLREGRGLEELVQAARDLLLGKAIDNPWRYLQRALPEWLAARQRATAPQVCAGDDELLWEMRLAMLESDGYWPPDAGGRPGEPYCRVPRNLLAQWPLAKRGA